MFKGKYILSKEGSWVAYYSLHTGEQIFKKYRKDITNEDYDMIMKDYVNATSSTLLVTEEGNKE